jgi:type I restriction enzyme S subunit
MKAMESMEIFGGGQHQGDTRKEGWAWKPLGEVCKTGSGGTPLSSRREYYEGGDIPWLLSGEVAQGNVREAKNFITKAGLESSAARLFPKGTILVAMYGATAGQVGILRFEAATNQAVCGILPNEKFVPEFLFYFFLAQKDELVAQATGNAQPNISQIKIKNTEVPLPPLPEQQRIVALLDEAFAGLATAKANAERNLQNARALFESHLQSVFSQRGDEWVESLLGSCCEQIFAGGDVPKDRVSKVRTSQYNVPIYSNGEKDDGLYGFTDIARVTKPSVTVSARGTLGFSAIRTEPFMPVVRLIVLVPDVEQISLPFLYYTVVGKDFGNTGTSIPQLTAPNIKGSILHIPPLSEQIAISEKLDALSEETQHLTRLYERKLAALEELKKSLLHQAFSGEL